MGNHVNSSHSACGNSAVRLRGPSSYRCANLGGLCKQQGSMEHLHLLCNIGWSCRDVESFGHCGVVIFCRDVAHNCCRADSGECISHYRRSLLGRTLPFRLPGGTCICSFPTFSRHVGSDWNSARCGFLCSGLCLQSLRDIDALCFCAICGDFRRSIHPGERVVQGRIGLHGGLLSSVVGCWCCVVADHRPAVSGDEQDVPAFLHSIGSLGNHASAKDLPKR
mmetsp:Transcript_62193/g.129050  ORF Transcript_62193/g.129050 Transcript_62193/m.129050 type:complete len:222 (+) Transcript_62193:297-962(+)